MHSPHNLMDLASQIYECEREGREISAGWYSFEKADRPSVERLRARAGESLEVLQTLSERIDAALQDGDGTDRALQHAYNIVQELIQSRTASQEMLENILNQDAGYQEFLRALSIKEKAAQEQAQQLKDALSQVH